MIHHQICKNSICNKEYETTNPRKLTCSRVCRLELRRQRRSEYFRKRQVKATQEKQFVSLNACINSRWPANMPNFTDAKVKDGGIRFTNTIEYSHGDSSISNFSKW
jgi:hypothetical protein